MGMAFAMSAMMAPTAAPFFVALGRDTRRTGAVALVVALYLAVWAAIGAGADVLMSRVMLPSSTLVGALAIAFAAAYALSPWSRWARARCRAMCRSELRSPGLRGALLDGSKYAACCVVCTAGVMASLVVLGMSNVLLIGLAAAAMLVYKLA
jgi:Predicted metal-binding integral membrane protein (DUF2182)